MDDAERSQAMAELVAFDDDDTYHFENDPPTDPILRGACALIEQWGMWADPTLSPEGALEIAAAVISGSGIWALLADARTEIDRWGFGDFHYGDTPRDPGVLAMLAKIDTVLGDVSRQTEAKKGTP